MALGPKHDHGNTPGHSIQGQPANKLGNAHHNAVSKQDNTSEGRRYSIGGKV
jgi:hypothetical protein